ncbi:MAG TPA: RNA-binding domain-containing protein [Solirubrobacteraceae bacterium]|nr:RNA-binding domain-containing protein [Solirubrobacteraceae bacterium]
MKIAEAIVRGEGPRLDFKRDLSSPKSVLKDIVAFANTAGGTVVIGLEDDGSVVGVADPLREEERLSSKISDGIEPQLLPEIYAVSHGEQELLVVEVAHHPAPFYLRSEGSDRGVYVRRGSTSRRAEPETLAELRRQAAGESFDLFARSDVAFDDLDKARMKVAFEGHDVPLRAAKLEALGVLTRYQGKVVATNAAVILLGQDATRGRYFRDARVEGARFAGATRAADIEDIFDPDEELTVLEAIDAAERFIRRNTRQAEPIPRGRLQRERLAEFSPVMVRELLVNAIAHADYSRTGETIKVLVFDDRVEILNPGPMLPGVTTEDIRNGRSKIRNRGIASVLRRIRYMERFGTAWEKIQAEMANGYPEPRFDGDGPVFRATLWPHPSLAGSGRHLSRHVGGINGGTTGAIGGLGKGDVARRRGVILDALAETDGLDAQELQYRLEIAPRTLERDLAALRDAGLVTRVGSRKTGHYRAVETAR